MHVVRPLEFFGIRCALSLALVSIGVTAPLHAQTASLTWDANPEADIAGYLVSYGLQPGNYTNSVDVRNTTTFSLTGLSPNTTYYFVVRAYSTAGLLGAASTQVTHTTAALGGGGSNGGGSNGDGPGAPSTPGLPTITSVSPASGPKAGGSMITLTGTNFLSGATVSIGGVQAATVIYVNATTLKVVTPYGAVGPQLVALTNPNDQGVFMVNGFTYTGVAPTLTGTAPASGPLAGGTELVLTGTGFNPHVGVLVGGVPATKVTLVNAQTLKALAPPRGAPGLVDVSITEAGQVQATISGGFRYTQPTSSEDTDGDGLPNAWELAWGLDPNSAAGANGAAGDPDEDGLLNIDEYRANSHPRGFVKRFFAEGVSNEFFDTRFALANPQDAPARVSIEYLDFEGQSTQQTITLAPRSRTTLIARDLPTLVGRPFSTRLEADQMIVFDRLMEWEATRYGSHAETAVQEPSTVWYFAEGATTGPYDLYYLLQNPTDETANVEIRYLLASGPPVRRDYVVGPRSRATIRVNSEGGALAAAEMSAEIRSTNGVPIIAERSMYFNRRLPYEAGHASAGVTAPSTEWFLAEGATGPFFMMFVLIGNPSSQDAQVHVTYMLSDGSPVQRDYTVAANSRMTINVGLEPELWNKMIASRFESTVPVIVERTMWWPGMPDQWTEGHNSFGVTATGTRWALAEGENGGPLNNVTYVLVANTSPFAGQAKVTLLLEGGGEVSRVLDLAPSSRINVPMDGPFAVAAGRRFGTIVESIGDQPAQIVVERAMYADPRGESWSSGSNAVATRLR